MNTLDIHWTLTNRCGLGCKHCFTLARGIDGELPLRHQRRIFEGMRRLASGHETCRVTFGGGDPALSPTLMEMIAAAAGEGWQVSIEANPDTLRDPIITALIDAGASRVMVGLETDKPRAAEALGRLDAPGRVELLRWIARTPLRSALRICLLRDLAGDVPALVDFAINAQVDEIVFTRWIPVEGTAQLTAFDPASYRKVFLAILQHTMGRRGARHLPTLVFEDSLAMTLLREIGLAEPEPETVDRACVLPNGDVGPFESAPLVVGNLWRDPEDAVAGLRRLWDEMREPGNYALCAGCRFADGCRGMPEHAHALSGAWRAPDPLCWVAPEDRPRKPAKEAADAAA